MLSQVLCSAKSFTALSDIFTLSLQAMLQEALIAMLLILQAMLQLCGLIRKQI